MMSEARQHELEQPKQKARSGGALEHGDKRLRGGNPISRLRSNRPLMRARLYRD